MSGIFLTGEISTQRDREDEIGLMNSKWNDFNGISSDLTSCIK